MHQLIKRIENSLNKDLLGITISNPRKAGEIRRYVIRPVLIREKLMYQLAAYTATQVFHENLTGGQLCGRLSEILPDYKQVLMQTASADIQALINKKGKAAIKITPGLKNEASVIKVRDLSHNRKKNYILKEGTPVPFLKDLGVMTGEGKIVRAKYDKFRQINRFLEYIEDIIPCLPADREITILDFGCGKSYLTFAVYYYLHEIRSMPVKIIGLDLKKDVIRTCSRLAAKYGYEKLDFYEGAIEEFEGVSQVDMVITLHACDTATDFALYKAVSWGASVILSVPCCQHELNAQLKNGQYSIITDYGILKERFAALATDGIRASLLEAVGYDTQILEFIDMEHTKKNLLIRAVKKNKRSELKWKEVEDFCEQFHFEPTLKKLLEMERKGST
ncbi:MAG: SAM-dependent methyltransferase [Eubacterium sp.]|nr:SAM-dependent methyltransferase [Eubacterium sp.]